MQAVTRRLSEMEERRLGAVWRKNVFTIFFPHPIKDAEWMQRYSNTVLEQSTFIPLSLPKQLLVGFVTVLPKDKRVCWRMSSVTHCCHVAMGEPIKVSHQQVCTQAVWVAYLTVHKIRRYTYPLPPYTIQWQAEVGDMDLSWNVLDNPGSHYKR